MTKALRAYTDKILRARSFDRQVELIRVMPAKLVVEGSSDLQFLRILYNQAKKESTNV